VTDFVITEADEPSIVSFAVGNPANLDIQTELSDGKWYFVVRAPQDYEMETQRRYRFLVQVAGTRQDVSITVVNEDDEYPFFDLAGSPSCQVSVSNVVTI
jgi:lipocalin